MNLLFALHRLRTRVGSPRQGRRAMRSAHRTSRGTEPGEAGLTVWIVNQYAVSSDVSGITRHVELGEQLGQHGLTTHIFATAFHHTTASMRRGVSIRRPVRHDAQHGVGFTWIWSTPYRQNGWKRYVNMLSFTGLFLTVAGRQGRPDVIIGSSPHLIAGLGAWLMARRYRVPFVFEVRDMWPDMLVQLGLTSPLIIRPLSFIEAHLYRHSNSIIALTDGIADRIAAKGVSRDKLVVIPNATLRPRPLDEAERAERCRSLGWEDKTVLVWAGAHNPMNGLDVVVEAAKHLVDRPDLLIVFIGDGSLKRQLIMQATGLPNVQFYDPVPKTEIGPWLRAADIGLVHSRRFELFSGARPNKLFEYMAAGLPIVSTVPGEAWRLIQEADAGVHAEWENPVSLAAAVATLADAPMERRAMGQRAFAYVSRMHSRERTAAHLAALLRSVCTDTRWSPTTTMSPEGSGLSLLESRDAHQSGESHAAD